MTFDEAFTALPHVRGGTIFLVIPHGTDLSHVVRPFVDTLLPMGIEVLVDNEITFVYGKLEDVDAAAFDGLSETRKQVIIEAITRYYVVLRAFLSIYTCRAYRLWEGTTSNNCGSKRHRGQYGDGGTVE